MIQDGLAFDMDDSWTFWFKFFRKGILQVGNVALDTMVYETLVLTVHIEGPNIHSTVLGY